MIAGKKNIKKCNNKYVSGATRIVFLLFIVYLAANVIVYLNTKHVASVEVKVGRLSSNYVYNGIALRKEKIVNSKSSGYVNYFAGEGKRVGIPSTVLALDNKGRLYEKIESRSAKYNINDIIAIRDNIYSIKSTDKSSLSQNISKVSASVLSLQQDLKNDAIIKSIKKIDKKSDSLNVKYLKPPKSGYVAYYIDGFEKKKPSKLKPEDFNFAKYEKNLLEPNAKVEKGDPVYKLTTSDNWDIAVLLDSDNYDVIKKFMDNKKSKTVKIRFLEDNTTTNALMSLQKNKNANYLILSLKDSVVRYVNERFVKFELIMNYKKGFKIPNSAITEKMFYEIPKDFIQKGGNRGADGVYVEKNDNGKIVPVFHEIDNKKIADDKLYISEESLHDGVVIRNIDDSSKHVIHESRMFDGVYVINKGYAFFNPIEIIDRNDRFSIADKEKSSGLSEYDYIVLDASTIKDNDIIYSKDY